MYLRNFEDWFVFRQGEWWEFFLFATASRPILGPTQSPSQCVPGILTPGLNRPEREADHTPPFSAELKNAWSFTSTPPVRPHGVVLQQWMSLLTRPCFDSRCSNFSSMQRALLYIRSLQLHDVNIATFTCFFITYTGARLQCVTWSIKAFSCVIKTVRAPSISKLI
jgi:hypothetical protein